MKHLLTNLLLAMATLLLLGTPAAAEDLDPPWWRGEPSTTSQVWEFSSFPDPPQSPPEGPPHKVLPDGPAAGGLPPLPDTLVRVTPGPPPWEQWLAEDMPFEYEPEKWVGRGVWPLTGTIDAYINNFDDPRERKLMWVQLTWRPLEPSSDDRPIFSNFDPPAVAAPEVIKEQIFADLWRVTTYAWELDKNPPDEVFTIGGNINVDELVVDTWCVPEPGSMVMLLGAYLVGLIAVVWRRRFVLRQPAPLLRRGPPE